jgi:hypothetical protein
MNTVIIIQILSNLLLPIPGSDSRIHTCMCAIHLALNCVRADMSQLSALDYLPFLFLSSQGDLEYIQSRSPSLPSHFHVQKLFLIDSLCQHYSK